MCENGSEHTDTVDPRVHVELERLNNATDEINRLEVDLDEARASFRNVLCDSTAKIDAIRLKLGLCVERAKPYYEARFCANEALKVTQVAAMRYEKANSAHCASREMVYLAEQGLGGRTLDPAWQEMLNHATQRVNESEIERGLASVEHRIACVKHETANSRVKSLQKELKRAITKSRPYYELKANFNYILEQQKKKVQTYESQVSTAKLTYAEALRNLEHISDEIHRTRNSANKATLSLTNKQISIDSNESSYVDDFSDEFKSLPSKLSHLPPLPTNMEDVEGYKSINIVNSISPVSTLSYSEQSERITHPCVGESQSTEWTEINLDVSSPEDEFKKCGDEKHRLFKQKTVPNSQMEDLVGMKSKLKLDASISNWISRSSAKNEAENSSKGRRQSLDNILGPTGEKVKEIWSQGMMMLNISSLTERRNSEPKNGITESGRSAKKLPSPLEKTLTYLNIEDDNSDTESLSSVDMLNEEQINAIMFDKEINQVCEQVLGTPINEVVSLPYLEITSQNAK